QSRSTPDNPGPSPSPSRTPDLTGTGTGTGIARMTGTGIGIGTGIAGVDWDWGWDRDWNVPEHSRPHRRAAGHRGESHGFQQSIGRVAQSGGVKGRVTLLPVRALSYAA